MFTQVLAIVSLFCILGLALCFVVLFAIVIYDGIKHGESNRKLEGDLRTLKNGKKD